MRFEIDIDTDHIRDSILDDVTTQVERSVQDVLDNDIDWDQEVRDRLDNFDVGDWIRDEAKRAMEAAWIGFDAFDEWAVSLMDQPYSTDQMRRELVPAVFGKFPTGDDVTDRAKRTAAEKRVALRKIWDGPTVQANKWGAIQAFNEYEQHVAGKPSFERTARKFINNDFKLTDRAIKVLANA